MADILKKIKEWEFTNKDSNITLNLDYTELPEIADVVDRKLWLTGEVDDVNINNIIYSILKYNAQDKNLDYKKRNPVYLYISSPGGSIVDGLALVSTICTSKTPVYTIVLGEACSMGLEIAITGHKRYSMPNAVYLMHDGSTGVLDSTLKARDRIEFDSKDLFERRRDNILSHTELTKKQYSDKCRQEWYFFPDVAKKYGFVDYIIGEDCELDEII